MANLSEQQASEVCHNQVYVILGQYMLRFLPTTADVVKCGMVCRGWHAAMALLPSEVHIDVLTAKQGLGMLWLKQNISRVLKLRLELPAEWPSKMRCTLRRRYTTEACEEACEVLVNAKHLQTLLYQLPQVPIAFAGSLCSLTALQQLTIDCCKQLREVPSTLGELAALQELQLIGCSCLKGLPSSISNLINLRQLVISSEANAGDWRIRQRRSIFIMPGEFWKLPALVEVHIHSEQCNEGSIWAEVPPVIVGLQQLEKLHLEGPDVVAPSVLRVIGQLTALTHLSLHSQYTMHSLPQQMCHLSNLQHLHIEGWSCLETLPEELGQLQSLKQLTLRYLGELQRLPDSLGCLRTLECLILDGMRELDSNLPESIGDLIRLQNLEVDNCWCIHALPEAIGRLTALQNLCIHETGIHRLPASVTALSSLQQLEFRNRQYTVADGIAVCVEVDEIDRQTRSLAEFAGSEYQ